MSDFVDDMLRFYTHKNEPTRAERLFDGFYAKAAIDEDLSEPPFWPQCYVDHIGHDHYDESIELFFIKATPLDLVVTEEQARIIFDWGFTRGWANFADGTEQYFARSGDGVSIGERRAVNSPRWRGED